MSEALATSSATSAFQKLVAKLREVFQIDQPDLDFGIYRIINARAAEIGDYLENQLRAKVDASLATGQQAGLADLQRDLAAAEQQARDLGADPATLPKVKDLRARVAALSGGATEHRDAVFSHLLTFFSRYYDRGDFISQRRYKGDTYAIPYSGEEVVLHWANKDQYYTKSGENFSNYTFSLADGRRVHFRLASADTAKDDRKDTDLERRFRLIAPRTVTRTGDDGEEVQEQQVPIVEVAAVPAAEGRHATPAELILWFEYVPLPKKGDSQDALNTRARDTVLADAAVKARWLDLAQRKPTEKNPQRTLLDKQLEDYTQKNKADYFIHKDLGGFLRRELDFYIKNEVMHLDDVQNAASFADIEKSLRMIQCLRAIALDLIAFLAQLEDFQKKLWLKKKFVVEAHYCITLDRLFKLGEDLAAKDTTRPGVLAERDWLLAQIAANEKQIAAWIDLGLVKNAECESVVASTDALFAQASTVAERLCANPFLMVDTQWFSTEFKYRLLAQLHDLDAQCDGLLVHSENFQALRLLKERYCGEVKCTYIDPPYNTGSDGFLYRDTLRQSSWLSFGLDRIIAAQALINENGLTLCSIDENQVDSLSLALSTAGGGLKLLTPFVWKRKAGGGDDSDHIAAEHEYVLCLARQAGATVLGKIEHESEAMTAKYNRSENGRRYYLERLDKTSLTYSEEMDFEIECPDGQRIKPPQPNPNKPTTIWRWSKTKVKSEADSLIFEREKKTNEWRIYTRTWESLDGVTPRSLLVDKHHGRNRDGTQEVGHLLGAKSFSNPKPLRLITHLLSIGAPGKFDLVMDFFAGSGTTGHAVIDRNREDSGSRRYILSEMGVHFDTILLKRVQKAIYSKNWKDATPEDQSTGVSHLFKYLRLESYEDTLNNLALKRPDGLFDLFDPAGKEDYLLHYMLNVESQASLLSVEDFKKPFDYKLRIATDSAGACQTRAVDLVETFNYLLGLRVAHLDAKLDLGYVLVSGKLPDGQSCLVVWRDCEKLDYEATGKLLDRHKITPNDNEYDVVYINGDHNIPTVAQATEAEGGVTRQLTLRQIEPEFITRMFTGEEA
jgi:adenine-specific DNA-methyltransferase